MQFNSTKIYLVMGQVSALFFGEDEGGRRGSILDEVMQTNVIMWWIMNTNVMK